MPLTDSYLKNLKSALIERLPGMDAHQVMDPMPRGARTFDHQDRKPRQSAVLILLFEEDGKWKFPLIQRPKYDGVHSGQIALPGGKYEKEDGDLITTALRETEEEIGVDRNLVTVLGQLSEIYIPPSNFNILPTVGYMDRKPAYIKQEREVAEIIETKTDHLIDLRLRQTRQIKLQQNALIDVPCFVFDETVVWGATAMILSEFAQILERKQHE